MPSDLVRLLGPVLCLAVGTAGLVAPEALARSTGVRADGPLGRCELRAAFGGLFVALGAGCLLLADPAAYLLAGGALLAGAAVKVVSAALVRGVLPGVLGGLAVDVVGGTLLVWGAGALG